MNKTAGDREPFALDNLLDILSVSDGSAETGGNADCFTESQWIEHLAQTIETTDETIRLGLSDLDDAACIAPLSSLGSGAVGEPAIASPPHEPSDLSSGGNLMAFSSDSICEGVHFLRHAPGWWLAQRIVYAAISDLYAVGAQPRYLLLNIVDNLLDRQRYKDFSRKLNYILQSEKLTLLGGNTTRGDSCQMHCSAIGYCPPTPHGRRASRRRLKGKSACLTRAGAVAGDCIVLTGRVGHYAAARQHWHWLDMRLPVLNHWLPIVQRYATACIDISDGLLTDLKKILHSSRVGADLWLDKLEGSRRQKVHGHSPTTEQRLYGGEDYILCFTVPKKYINNNKLDNIPINIIGKINPELGLECFHSQDDHAPCATPSAQASFEHFSAS